MGLPEEVLGPIRAMYSVLQRRFRCGLSVGAPFAATNGILQGCPLSVVLLNALISVWLSAVAEEVNKAVPQAYADDTHSTCQTRRAVQLVADVTQDFATSTGQRVNASKSFGFTT
eukprot:12423316-Karenia_brevis.AAC.1